MWKAWRVVGLAVVLGALLAPAPAFAGRVPREVVSSLRAAGLPITAARYFNAATDPNKLLGRPGQYVAKCNFRDRRADTSPGFDVENGGSVETFANAGDAWRRYRYLVSITRAVPLLGAEYDYLAGTVLLRVSRFLTPVQAKAYKAAL